MAKLNWIKVATDTIASERMAEFVEPNKGLPVVLLPGVAQWPRLDEPDTKFPKANSPKGEYNVKLKYDAQSVENTNAFLEPLFAEARKLAIAALKSNPKFKTPALLKKAVDELEQGPFFTALVDDDTAQPTGEATKTFSKPAAFIDKKDGNKVVDLPPPYAVDSKGAPLKEHIGAGSKLIPSVLLQPYYVAGASSYGVRCKFLAVQVLDLKRGGAPRTADDYGFDKHEDGYETNGEGGNSDPSSDRDPTDF